ncbi:alcohol dehydrogenase catalytic domain-containing protein [Streptomyces sp. NPDC001858]
MKAVGLTEFGGPEVLRVLELPVPEVGPGQIRIRVRAAGVNPVDALVRRGIAHVSGIEPPYVPGMDAAGVVEEIGQGVDTDPSIAGANSGERGIVTQNTFVPHYAREYAKLVRIRQLAEEGRLVPRVAKALSAEEAAEAHQLLEAGGLRGRVVLTF